MTNIKMPVYLPSASYPKKKNREQPLEGNIMLTAWIMDEVEQQLIHAIEDYKKIGRSLEVLWRYSGMWDDCIYYEIHLSIWKTTL